MSVPRDLSKRMLEAIEPLPVVDVYERLIPESKRVSQRVDFISWFVAYVGEAMGSVNAGMLDMSPLGLDAEGLALLEDVQGDPDRRWSLMSRFWPYVRTTAVGRVVLRMAWDLFGVAEINERTWKDVSARLWKISERGFYQQLLSGKARIVTTLVDGPVEAEMQPCCVPVQNCDPMLEITNSEDLGTLATGSRDRERLLKMLDERVAVSVRQAVQQGVVAFRVPMLADGAEDRAGLRTTDRSIPSAEEVMWAASRLPRGEETESRGAPVLRSYLWHSLVERIAETGRPVLVSPDGLPSLEQLDRLAHLYRQVRFVALLGATYPVRWRLDPNLLLVVARTAPNITLALGDVWFVAPHIARQTLHAWLEAVPLHRLIALGGNTTMVEASCAQALIVREQVASVLAEMIAGGELDEDDARLAMARLLSQNAMETFGLKAAGPTENEG